MRAMQLHAGERKLICVDAARPEPGDGQLLLQVCACGVCRTDLHILDGELAEPKLPLIPGHQIVGRVIETGRGVERFKAGARVGVPWVGWTCGECRFCRSGRENLCVRAKFTGYTIDGGYAEYTVAHEKFCFPLSDDFPDEAAAPLLCAGLIGYRSLKKTGDAKRIGFYGFGSSASIIAQVAKNQGREVYAFTRPGDTAGQDVARKIGAVWAGGSDTPPPELLDAALIFASAGPLVPVALRALDRGGVVVCAGIHMSDIPAFPYDILWKSAASSPSRT